jgi:DNA-binding CsgD family transcriptional regulator
VRSENDGKEPAVRLTGEALMRRDDQVAALRGQGLSFRQVARRLGCSLGSVQQSVRRVAQRKPPPSPDVLAMYRGLRGKSGPELAEQERALHAAVEQSRRSERA